MTTWNSPNAVAYIEKCVQIITKKNLLIEIPRLQVRATINAAMKKKGIDLIDIKAPILLPNNAAVAPISISPYAAPAVNAGVDIVPAAAATVANLVGTATAFRGTLTYLWTVKTKPVGSNPVMATPAALANAISAMTVVGVYVFTLTATDSNGFSASDDVQVTYQLKQPMNIEKEAAARLLDRGIKVRATAPLFLRLIGNMHTTGLRDTAALFGYALPHQSFMAANGDQR